MDTSEIIYHNRSSTDFGLRVFFPTFNPPVPTPNAQRLTIPGVSGDYSDGNGSYGPVDMAINGIIHMPARYNNFYTYKGDLEKWLLGDAGYLNFTLDPDYLYIAEVTTPPVLTPVNDERINATITFHFQPYKMQRGANHWHKFPSNGVITNDENVNVKPDWHLNATGNVMLTVNDEPYEFDNLDGDIYVVGHEGNAYASDPDKQSDHFELLNTHIRFANNEAPELICSGNGQNKVSVKALDDKSKLNSIEFKPLLRRLI